MKQRNIMAVILLSIFTLGIYDLYWLVKTKNDLNKRTDVHTPSIWLLFAPYILLVVGLIVIIIAAAGSTTTISSSGTSSSSNASFSGIVILFEVLAFLILVPITFYWFFKFSKAVNHFTHGEMNTAMTFILLWLLRFIGLALIQDKFNDILQAGGPTQGATPQFAAAPGGAMPPAPGTFSPQAQVQPQFMPPQAPVAPTMDNPWPPQPEQPQPPMPDSQPPVDPNQPPQPPVPPQVQ